MTATTRPLTLPKSARLHHSSLTGALFAEGKSLYEFPLRLSWRALTEEELRANFRLAVPPGIGRTQVLVSVPKKKRRKAVDRVLMRRRIREAYRLCRPLLDEALAARPDVRTLSIGFVWLHNENVPYQVVEERMRSLLGRLARKLTRQRQ